jgi:hypothetical protein
LKKFDATSSGLSLHGFKQALLSSEGFHSNPLSWKEREVLLVTDLISMGYDDNLNLISSRGCVLSLHCDTPTLSLTPLSFTPELYEEAIESPILLTDKPKRYPKDEYVIFTQRNGYAGASIVAKNMSRVSNLLLTMAITGKNVMSHQGSLTVTVSIPPGEAKVIHHLFPEVEPGGWSYKQAVTFERVKV